MNRIPIRTHEREELLDITREVRERLKESGVREGVMHMWSMHTTCALTVNEGADPDVARDVVVTLKRLVPQSGDYRHSEGNSDSHVKTSLLGPGLTLLIEDGELVLGTWQRVFLCEWDGPRSRQIAFVIQPN